MLEKYFVKPETVDRIRGSWIAGDIEGYVEWLDAHGYATKSVWHRVPVLFAFGEFTLVRGATTTAELPNYVEAFVSDQVAGHHARTGSSRSIAKEIRGPIEQMLAVALPGFELSRRTQHAEPFADAVPGFFDYLEFERGLRPDTTVRGYRYHLGHFEAYLRRMGVESISELTPTLLSTFVIERAAAGLAKASLREEASVLRVFLRFAHRERLMSNDLSNAVGAPLDYRLGTIPRSISQDQVKDVLAQVDRRTETGKRDFAILLLLVTYGLRSREIAKLTLDDLDWKRERLAIPERKAGHSTAFPLTVAVGEAIVDYLQHARPATTDRHVFFRSVAPRQPLSALEVSSRARHYLLKAGVDVPRLGSHTLRHTAVQRLVDADFDLKTIGDFVGHRSPRSTEIYAKVAVEALREIALGDGEEVLA
jgi:integrase/recombinase XerD